MKKKTIYFIVMLLVAVFLIWEQTKEKASVYSQAIGIAVFFYGMMRLSSETPSKNQDNQE